jgi:hypothetical protein
LNLSCPAQVEVRHVGVNKSLVLEEVLRMGPRGETVRERPAEASAVATTPGAPAATSGSAATSPDSGTDQGRTRERNSKLQSLISRPFSTRFG